MPGSGPGSRRRSIGVRRSAECCVPERELGLSVSVCLFIAVPCASDHRQPGKGPTVDVDGDRCCRWMGRISGGKGLE